MYVCMYVCVPEGYQAGGQLMLTSDVENFPGYREAISGPDMMEGTALCLCDLF